MCEMYCSYDSKLYVCTSKFIHVFFSELFIFSSLMLVVVVAGMITPAESILPQRIYSWTELKRRKKLMEQIGFWSLISNSSSMFLCMFYKWKVETITRKIDFRILFVCSFTLFTRHHRIDSIQINWREKTIEANNNKHWNENSIIRFMRIWNMWIEKCGSMGIWANNTNHVDVVSIGVIGRD